MKQAGIWAKINRLVFRQNIWRWLYVVLFLGAVALRMAIAASQRVFLMPEGSGLDDMLMIRAAQSITAGQWLGAYGGVAIAKNMGFAVWLAFLHALRVPVLLGNAALWLAACAFAVWALRPLFKGNLGRLLLFVFLAYQPLSYAFFTQRVYRDSVFPTFSLLFFAGVLGLCLRLALPSGKGSILAALGAGFGLADAWLMREDGLLLLVFGICAAVVLAAFVLFNKQVKKRVVKLLCVALPFVVLGAGVLGFSAANQKHYGVFMVSDLTEGTFPAAYGAIVAVAAAESEYMPLTPVPQQTLQKLYQEVPTMALLKPQLQSSNVLNGFGNPQTGEYGGSFYYALRLAADYGGYTPTAPAAQAFWAQLLQEVQTAVAQGRLKSVKAGSSTVPLWHSSLLAPTLAETGRGLLAVFTFSDDAGTMDIYPAESMGTPEAIQQVAQYLYSPVQQGYVAGTSQPYYNMVQKICFAIANGVTWVYRILLWPLAALALVVLCKTLGKTIWQLFNKRKAGLQLVFAVLLLGLLLSTLLRVGVAAYMEAAAFNIGVYLMYFSGALPPLLLLLAAAPGLQNSGWVSGSSQAQQN
ncbi:hypothetical protein LJC61_09200 [Ruminococcaceae bacterium OttesenSCG-928-A16]|nr:hypothetical protein [Ruminococcaceae bacterium OttesenSCG-928-A16]